MAMRSPRDTSGCSGSLARYTLSRELAFRGNFLVKVSVEVLWLGILLAFYRTVFARTQPVAGWPEDAVPLLRRLLLRPERPDRDALPGELQRLRRAGPHRRPRLPPAPADRRAVPDHLPAGSTGATAPNVLMGAGRDGRSRSGQMHWQFDPVRVAGLPGHVRLRDGDRLQLHADADVAVGLDGPQPEPDGDVVAVHQPGALPQGDLPRAPGPSRWARFFTFVLPILLVVNVPADAMVRVLDPRMVGFTLVATAALLWVEPPVLPRVRCGRTAARAVEPRRPSSASPPARSRVPTIPVFIISLAFVMDFDRMGRDPSVRELGSG